MNLNIRRNNTFPRIERNRRFRSDSNSSIEDYSDSEIELNNRQNRIPDFNLDLEGMNLMETNRISRYNRKKIKFINYCKRLLFLYAINTVGYLYLHYILLAHQEEDKMDFTNADLIFFLTLPLFCLFPVNHLLSKNNYKHYLTYILGYFNGLNFSLISTLGNLNDFVLNTERFKKNDDLHMAVLILLIILGIYSIGYTLYVSKRRKLVSALIFTPIIITTIYCTIMKSQGYIIHIHHYIIGIFLILISYHPRYITLIINSVSFGVYLEGIVQWGYAPIIYT